VAKAAVVALWAKGLQNSTEEDHRNEERDADRRSDQHRELVEGEDDAAKEERSSTGGGDRTAHNADAHVLVGLANLVEAALLVRVHVVSAKVHDVVD